MSTGNNNNESKGFSYINHSPYAASATHGGAVGEGIYSNGGFGAGS